MRLLDANVVIALVVEDHLHHAAAERWFVESPARAFATCPITQGSAIRFLVREGLSGVDAFDIMSSLTEQPGHVFWADDVPFERSVVEAVRGHRQVTDAYLAAAARRRAARVATFDEGLASAHPDATELILRR